jgi:hypothetical protein
VDTVGRRFHVEWDPAAPVTPLDQLVFFCQFPAAGGLYSKWVADCPLRYTSPNAPSQKDLLGTWVLSSLSGAWRYAHVTALRGDRVNPEGLGMAKVVSEDSLRRAFEDQDGTAMAAWQTEALLRTYAPALEQPWIADLDVTVKPIYGHQEGAELGYNPHKPGHPSHAYHTVFLRTLRVALDGRLIKSGGQTTLRLTSHHAEASHIQSVLSKLSLFLSGLINAAEQLQSEERWRRIWRRILEPYRLPAAACLAPSG